MGYPLHKIIVPAFPTLRFSSFIGNNVSLSHKLTATYGDADFKFLYFGRSAIWNAVKLLGLKPEDNLLVPSYHCSIEIEAILQAGVKVRFFEINSDMIADLSDLKKKIDEKAKAVFVIHYFGFPQPIDEIWRLCMEKGLFLIEDCAHAFLSKYNDKPLGTYGDFGVLSMQKFIPLPSGGILLTNNPAFNKPIELRPPNARSVMRTMFLLSLKNIAANHNKLYHCIASFLIEPLRKGARLMGKKHDHRIVNLTSVDFSPEVGNLGMSWISERIAGNVDFEEIVAIRRTNYGYLLERLKGFSGIKICFQQMPEGCCPYFLPIELENRKRVQADLLQQGVSTFIFGEFLHASLPSTGFDKARYLSKNVLALPVHQDLKLAQIEYMVNNLKGILSKK